MAGFSSLNGQWGLDGKGMGEQGSVQRRPGAGVKLENLDKNGSKVRTVQARDSIGTCLT